MAKQYWLVKSEPESYSWSDLVNDGKTAWTGVRNFQARNNLRAMKKGDLVFFYHSVSDKQIVGIAKVVNEAYTDKTAKEGDWSAVDLAPEKPLKRPVSLDEIKTNPALKDMALVRIPRISVTPVAEDEWERIISLSSK
jgi:predicted RNA-binding protein with PUA-like domain